MIADPDELRRAAARLDGEADQLDTLAGELDQAASHATWQGPAADRWRTDVAQETGRLRRDATRLRQLAVLLRRSASRVEDELRDLARIEHAITAWLSGLVPAGIVAPWTGLPWGLGDLPATGAPVWREVAVEARRRGAPV